MGAIMNFLLFLWWTATFLSILGAYWVAEGKKQGFLVWCISNPLIMLQVYLTGSWNLLFLYGIFWILAIYGYLKRVKKVKNTIKVIS